jgi:hypothetical protein
MSDQQKVQELTSPQPKEVVSREWLITDDETRQLYSDLLGTGQKRPSVEPKPPEDSPAPAKQTTSASKPLTSRDALTPLLRAPREDQKESQGALAIRIVAALALLTILYAAYAYVQRSKAPAHSQVKTRNDIGQQKAPAALVADTAGSQQSISLSPTLSAVTSGPGQTAKQTLTLVNKTPNELSFEVVVEDMVVRDGKAVFVPAGVALNGLAATAVFAEKYFNVKPQQTKPITIEFTVPPQTASRGVLVLLRGTDKLVFGKATMTASLGAVITVDTPDSSTAGLDGAGTSTAAASFALSQWAMDVASAGVAMQQTTSGAEAGKIVLRQSSNSGLSLGGQP